MAPLTVGSTRQAGIELDKTFGDGPGGRVRGGYAIISRENPGYDIRDLRHDVRVEGSRQFARVLNASTHAGWADVSFGDVHDQLIDRRCRSVGGYAGEYGVSEERDLRERRVGGALAELRRHHQPLYP